MSDQLNNQDMPAPNTPGAGEMTTSPGPKAAVSAPQTPTFPTDPRTPPLQPGAAPQLAGMMIQHTIGQPQQNPEVMQHLCTFLSHDSDNRLQWFQTRDQKRHVFRMTALVIVAILSVLVLSIPLVALWRSDMAFVKEFLDRYLTQIIMVALALLGGGKLFDLLK